MPRLFIRDRAFVAFTFKRVDMHDRGTIDILDLFENFNKRADIVAVLFVNIVKSEILENIMLRFSVAVSEFFEVFIKSAVRFGNRLLIVVDDYYQI